MGREKYLKKVEELFRRSPVVNADSISRVVRSKKRVKQYNKQLIRNLVLGKKIKKLAKGCYTVHNDPSLAVFCFNPAYLGLQDALSFHNLWEQEAIPVIVTARKVRLGIRKVLGMNILVRRIDRKYFFGVEYVKHGNFFLPVSDVEKTFLDMVYFKQGMDEGLVKNFKGRMDKRKLEGYLRRYPKRLKTMVLARMG